MKTSTQSNSSIGTFRRCPREYEYSYERMIEPVGDGRETLAVGTTWHEAFDAEAKGKDPIAVIREIAPSELWGEKLARLFAAYGWYWRDQPFDVIRSEVEFQVTLDGRPIRGKADAVLRTADGRIGLGERKTSGENLAGDYFDRLRLDPQTPLYALALAAGRLFSDEELSFIDPELIEEDAPTKPPDFILYDVVRKPTINPKALSKKDVARMRKELAANGPAMYYGEEFTEDAVDQAEAEGKETVQMYGARLTADIGDRPDYYFARREVHRGATDYETLVDDLRGWLALIEACEKDRFFPRDPGACKALGTCSYFGLCSNNIYPALGVVPDGFQCRKYRHPELDFGKDETDSPRP